MWFFFVSFLTITNGLINQSVVGMFTDEESCMVYAQTTLERASQNPYVQVYEYGCKEQIKGTNS